MSRFHFTLGPVQGFVSQARRTRDFWAGSFLLSWLTAHAMKAVQDADTRCKIVMPYVKGDKLLARVNANAGKGPDVGSLPNNFIAEVADDFDGNAAVNAVQKAWKDLADAVWEKDKLAEAGVSKDLWDAQISGFWDMAWVMSDSDDAAVLAQRKNWRSYMPPQSLGDKCTMMGEWQELSGAERPSPKQQQQPFWAALKKRAGISDIEIRDNERLCAIAYVKRRFVHAWQGVAGHQGWKLPSAVPSTSYMAAVHWLEDAIAYAPEDALKQFHDAGKKAAKGYGAWATKIACIEAKVDERSIQDRFTSLDGRIFFKASLENRKEFKEEDSKPVLDALKVLKDVSTSKGNKLGEASPFYAILMMDGDSLGETKEALAKAGKDATALSQALAAFTKAVPDEVKKHNGFLIYAGGDDVLAILPLENALPCAAACRVEYAKAFDTVAKGVKASISAAIEYAHMKLPLTMILKDAHKLLDEVAKDATGRDAVACRIWKPSGLQQTWAMPWDIPERRKGDAVIAHAMDMITLVQEMEQRAEKKSDVGYSSKLFYNFRETLKMVLPDKMPKDEKEIVKLGEEIQSLELDKLLEVTYLNSGLLDGWSEKEEGKSKQAYVREQITKLMMLMRVYNNQGDWDGLYSSDGALLLRFLAQKGVER